jgi:type I restriction enzyme S subunit
MSEHPLEPLNKICDINPDTLSETADASRRYRYIDLSSIKEQKADLSITPEAFAELPSRARRKVRRNDVLLGTVRPNLKNFALIDSDDDDLLCSTGFAVLRSKKDISDPRFIFQAINSEVVERQLNALVTGSNYPAVNASQVAELLIPVPPLPEQKKIAEILSGIDKMINGISDAIEKSEIMLTGIFADLDLIASSGKTTELGEVASIQNGYAFQSSVFTEDPLGIPLIRISNISGGMVDASKSKKIPRTQVPSDEYKVTNGDILIAMSGATTGKIGRYQGDTFCLLNQRVGKFVFHPGGSGAPYVTQLLLSGFLEGRILSKAAGGAQPNISGKGIEGIEIPFPDAAEQSRYGNTIQELLRVNSARKDLVEKYQHLKSAISADLLSGRKKVSV